MEDRAQLDAQDRGRIWRSILGRLELELNRHSFTTWFAGTRATSFDGGGLVVETKSVMAREYLDRRMRVVVERAAANVLGGPVSIRFVAAGERAEPSEPLTEAAPVPVPQGLAIGTVNCAFTFEGYLASSGNQLALEACLAIVEPSLLVANPVVLYGAPGLGKTHLLHALACRAKSLGRNVACLSAEEFANRYIGAVRAHRVDDFHDQIRAVDLLIIDDLQAIAGKKATQDELVWTMDAVCNSGGHVVAASERHPFELGLPERLESRLSAGIITRVEPFDCGERRAFVEHVAKRSRVGLPGWAIDRLAALNVASVRVLLGGINAAMALELRQKLEGRALDASLAGVAVRESSRPSGELELLERVARHFNVAAEDLVSRTRSPRLNEARAVATAGLQQRGYSLSRIATLFGGRDKSTMSGLAGRGRALIEENEQLTRLLAG